MTGDIFKKWLMKLDHKFLRDGKKIALVLDNATCHPPDLQLVLKSIKLVFLPPNTTSVVQPMDQGIICNFKIKFKNMYTQALVEKRPWDILKVCFAIVKAWELVTPQTISNSFRHCGFVHTSAQADVEVIDEDDLPLAELMRQLQCTQEEAEAFYTVDDNLLTSAPATIDDIAQTFVPGVESDSDEESSEVEPAIRKISRRELNDAFWVLKMYTVTSENPVPDFFKHISEAEKIADKQFAASMKQKSISDFFM